MLKEAFSDAFFKETDFVFDSCFDVSTIKQDITKKTYKELILNELNKDKDALITAFVDKGILKKNDIDYLPIPSTKEIEYLVNHFYAKQSSTLKLLKNYQFFMRFYQNESIVFQLLETNAEQRKIVIQRIKSNNRQKAFRKLDENVLTKYELEIYTRYKKFAVIVKQRSENNHLSKDYLIELSKEISTKYKKAYPLPYYEILNILNTFYNVYCDSKGISNLHSIDSKNEYYYIVE